MNRAQRFVSIVTGCLFVVFLTASCGGSDSDPFLQIVNSSEYYTIDQVTIDGEDLLSAGETIEDGEEMDFPVTEGSHFIRVSIPGHPMYDPEDSFSKDFPMGYYYEVKYLDNTKIMQDHWSVDYWNLD